MLQHPLWADHDSTPTAQLWGLRERIHVSGAWLTVRLSHCQLLLSPLPSKWISKGNKPKRGGVSSTFSSEVWGDGVARKRGWGEIHSENKVLEPSALLLSCQQSHSGIICHAESDCAPRLLKHSDRAAPPPSHQSPSPGQTPLRHAPLKPSPWGPVNLPAHNPRPFSSPWRACSWAVCSWHEAHGEEGL